MSTKTIFQKCILVITTRGFDEVETIHLISVLREAGLCVKSLGATSGLVAGRYGIYLMPDLTFSDLDDLAKTSSASVVILPENRQCLIRLEADPRLHNFLRHLLAQGGQIVVGPEGRQFLKKTSVGDPGLFGSSNRHEPLLLLREHGQSIETLAHDLVYRIGEPLRV